MSLPVLALILAAGRSRRMGAFKPLLPLGGETVLERSVRSALEGGARSAVVVTGNRADELEALLLGRWPERVRCVRNPDWAASDMLRSVQTGAAALGPCSAFFLLPGDMPLVKKSSFFALLAEREHSGAPLVLPRHQGRQGHPPLIDASLLPAILSYSGADGLRGLWRSLGIEPVLADVSDPGTLLDLDTPEDYKRWKEGTLAACARHCAL